MQRAEKLLTNCEHGESITYHAGLTLIEDTQPIWQRLPETSLRPRHMRDGAISHFGQLLGSLWIFRR